MPMRAAGMKSVMASEMGAANRAKQQASHHNSERLENQHEKNVEELLSIHKRQMSDGGEGLSSAQDSLHSHYGKLFLKYCEDAGLDPSKSAPTVEVCVTILSISDVNPLEHKFDAEYTYILDWVDPSLKQLHDMHMPYDPENHFIPKVDIDNAVSGLESLGETPSEVEDVDLCHLSLMKKMMGPMKTRFDLKMFPFDWQALEIHFICERVKFVGTDMVTDPSKKAGGLKSKHHSTAYADVRLTNPYNWRKHGHRIEENADWLSEWDLVRFDGAPDGKAQEIYRLQVIIVRDYRAEFWGMLFPMTALAILSMSPFALAYDDLGTRLETNFSVVFTIFAFKLFLASEIPKVPYLTMMDTCIVMGLTLLLVQGVGYTVVASAAENPVWDKHGLFGKDWLTPEVIDGHFCKACALFLVAAHVWVIYKMFETSTESLQVDMKCKILESSVKKRNVLAKDLLHSADFEIYDSPEMVRTYVNEAANYSDEHSVETYHSLKVETKDSP